MIRFFLLLLVLLPGLPGCRSEAQSDPEPIRTVRILTVKPLARAAIRHLPGEVRPRWQWPLAFQVGGRLIQRRVEVGQVVRPGQILARLDPEDLELAARARTAEAAAARAELDLARVAFKRVESLRQGEVASRAEYDRLQAMVETARARLAASEALADQTRHQVTYTRLSSEVEAVVTAIQAENGQVVTAGQPILHLAGLQEKEVHVAVPEVLLPRFREQPDLTVTLAAFPERSWKGQVRTIGPMADALTRTFPVRIALPNDAAGPELGSSVKILLNDPPQTAILLPLSALHTRDGQPGVWVVQGSGVVQRIGIQTDGLRENQLRVVAGLQGGEQVVVAGANLVREGQTVSIVEEIR
ncbi:MAG: efflux RND transporter periplasmic adaptor subunit [Magnetococcus sp. DMHC-1]|nr:efflux RND transporter periplasmic adaptor subunit [Magnetococcales bacterium]